MSDSPALTLLHLFRYSISAHAVPLCWSDDNRCCLQTRCCRRCPIEYPHQPLVLKIIGTKGLATSDSRALSKLLNSSSSQHAKDGVVAGFSLADACQEFLLGKNFPEAVKNDSTVIWHCSLLDCPPLCNWYDRNIKVGVCRLMVRCGTACSSGIVCP